MHFRRARSSPAGYLYAPCSRSSDPLILPSSLTEEVRLAISSNCAADFPAQTFSRCSFERRKAVFRFANNRVESQNAVKRRLSNFRDMRSTNTFVLTGHFLMYCVCRTFIFIISLMIIYIFTETRSCTIFSLCFKNTKKMDF